MRILNIILVLTSLVLSGTGWYFAVGESKRAFEFERQYEAQRDFNEGILRTQGKFNVAYTCKLKGN